MEFECEHRDKKIKRIETCQLCGMSGKQIPVYGCELYGECTIHAGGIRQEGKNNLPLLPTCISCPKRTSLLQETTVAPQKRKFTPAANSAPNQVDIDMSELKAKLQSMPPSYPSSIVVSEETQFKNLIAIIKKQLSRLIPVIKIITGIKRVKNKLYLILNKNLFPSISRTTIDSTNSCFDTFDSCCGCCKPPVMLKLNHINGEVIAKMNWKSGRYPNIKNSAGNTNYATLIGGVGYDPINNGMWLNLTYQTTKYYTELTYIDLYTNKRKFFINDFYPLGYTSNCVNYKNGNVMLKGFANESDFQLYANGSEDPVLYERLQSRIYTPHGRLIKTVTYADAVNAYKTNPFYVKLWSYIEAGLPLRDPHTGRINTDYWQYFSTDLIYLIAGQITQDLLAQFFAKRYFLVFYGHRFCYDGSGDYFIFGIGSAGYGYYNGFGRLSGDDFTVVKGGIDIGVGAGCGDGWLNDSYSLGEYSPDGSQGNTIHNVINVSIIFWGGSIRQCDGKTTIFIDGGSIDVNGNRISPPQIEQSYGVYTNKINFNFVPTNANTYLYNYCLTPQATNNVSYNDTYGWVIGYYTLSGNNFITTLLHPQLLCHIRGKECLWDVPEQTPTSEHISLGYPIAAQCSTGILSLCVFDSEVQVDAVGSCAGHCPPNYTPLLSSVINMRNFDGSLKWENRTACQLFKKVLTGYSFYQGPALMIEDKYKNIFIGWGNSGGTFLG